MSGDLMTNAFKAFSKFATRVRQRENELFYQANDYEEDLHVGKPFAHIAIFVDATRSIRNDCFQSESSNISTKKDRIKTSGFSTRSW